MIEYYYPDEYALVIALKVLKPVKRGFVSCAGIIRYINDFVDHSCFTISLIDYFIGNLTFFIWRSPHNIPVGVLYLN